MNMMKMMQKAGQMKSKMAEMQKQVQQERVIGEAGNGLVEVTLDGGFRCHEIKIDKSVVNAEEVDVLEDMVLAALNDAHQKTTTMIETETKKVLSDLGLPENLDLPF